MRRQGQRFGSAARELRHHNQSRRVYKPRKRCAMSCYLTGYGMALPSRVVTNLELAPMLAVSPEWIEASSGIRERRWVEANQSTSDLAVAAVCDALTDAGARA